jgi:ABC-2 type transport system ATP-binding protein
MIEFDHVTKRFKDLVAVNDLSFGARPGRITGFLGPNGAGKTTALRCAVALVRPNAGRVTFAGQEYGRIDHAARSVGTVLEASSFHPGRTALGHLRTMAPGIGVGDKRCHECLEFVGLAGAANKRVGKFSLGMRGRLGLAGALLGDPHTLILDEPINGLDPEGIAWIRGLLRNLAREGRTILISSHMLSEVQQTVDDVVIITRGRMTYQGSLSQMRALTQEQTLVESPQATAFEALLSAHPQWQAQRTGPGKWLIHGPDAAAIGLAAFEAQVPLTQLASQTSGLEATFLALTDIQAQSGPAPYNQQPYQEQGVLQ